MNLAISNNKIARANRIPTLFAPDWGAQGNRIWDLISAVRTGELDRALAAILDASSLEAGPDELKLFFSASVLRDVVRAGGDVWVRDSRLFVAWPDWEGPAGRLNAQVALSAAREMRPLNSAEMDRVKPLFAPDVDGEQLAQVLAEGTFQLEVASNMHPSGVPYSAAFAAALRYWTMPYRGRTGRMKRFVLTATHPVLGAHPVVAAILELGDEAPFCTWRDDLLGLSKKAVAEWVRAAPEENALLAAKRLRAFRGCLLPTSSGKALARASLAQIMKFRDTIEAQAHGRSLAKSDEGDELKDRKRLIYGLRLARGEHSLTEISQGKRLLDPEDPDFGAGVRALHDILLPRLHLEATVCGAVPPFSDAYGGKLIASFLTHPEIVRAPLDSKGGLLSWSFDMKRLSKLTPEHGMLCLTTKGLYAGHAAIYNRATAPGLHKPVRMIHVANTEGATTTLLSTDTMKLARRVLEIANSKRVSMEYGTGGSKRHRSIEAALALVGLPSDIAMAGIRRPVYALPFVKNPTEICWAQAAPEWLIDASQSEAQFCLGATELWRSRWLQKATNRVQDYVMIPSLIRRLEMAVSA